MTLRLTSGALEWRFLNWPVARFFSPARRCSACRSSLFSLVPCCWIFASRFFPASVGLSHIPDHWVISFSTSEQGFYWLQMASVLPCLAANWRRFGPRCRNNSIIRQMLEALGCNSGIFSRFRPATCAIPVHGHDYHQRQHSDVA